jgi:hypothetical protein
MGEISLGDLEKPNGFGWIAQISNLIYMSDDDLIEMELKNHPFELATLGEQSKRTRNTTIKYLRSSGRDLVVEKMPIAIARELSMDAEIVGLRVINSQSYLTPSTNHRVFYEVASDQNIYMVEGATDCSGHGGTCKEHLDAMFSFLSYAFDVKIEIVEIPYLCAERMEQKIRNLQSKAYNEREREE